MAGAGPGPAAGEPGMTAGNPPGAAWGAGSGSVGEPGGTSVLDSRGSLERSMGVLAAGVASNGSLDRPGGCARMPGPVTMIPGDRALAREFPHRTTWRKGDGTAGAGFQTDGRNSRRRRIATMADALAEIEQVLQQ